MRPDESWRWADQQTDTLVFSARLSLSIILFFLVCCPVSSYSSIFIFLPQLLHLPPFLSPPHPTGFTPPCPSFLTPALPSRGTSTVEIFLSSATCEGKIILQYINHSLLLSWLLHFHIYPPTQVKVSASIRVFYSCIYICSKNIILIFPKSSSRKSNKLSTDVLNSCTWFTSYLY